jgi:CPA1 family monovalent cation:H+ antiporter
MHSTFITYIYLLLVISFLVMLAQRLKIAYPIVLVLGGLVLSFIPRLPAIEINPDLIFVIFLPPLLYEAAWQTSWKELWRWRRVISSFAFLIVLVTSCVIAFVSSSVIPGFTLSLGFLLGGIISPPDAVSATSIMRNIKVPKRLVSIVEGESLLNDAASIIVFRFALAAVDTGKFAFGQAALNFFIVIIMGVLTGLAVALVFYAIHRWLPTTASIDIVLTFVTPYIMYILAEKFHFSGVLAVVSGGLFLSSRQQTILSPLSRIQGFNVWSIVSFVLNGLIFMLIGLELPVIVRQLGNTSLVEAIKYGLIICLTLIICRMLCTFGASIFTRFISRFITTADPNPGWKGPILFGWAGMRGVVSLAAALSIPIYLSNHQPFPQRNLILFITFSVILVTLVFQGLTLPLLVRWVKMEENDYSTPAPQQEILVRKKMTHAALNLLDSKYERKLLANELLQGLKQGFSNDFRLLEHAYRSNQAGLASDQVIDEFREIAVEIITVQRELLHKLNSKAEIDEDIVKKYYMILDHEEEKLKQQFGD